MKPALKTTLAVIAGAFAGSILNGTLITLSPMIIPPPDGVDLTTAEGLKAGMALMQPKHFLMPWLAHALGTLLGALVAVLIAKKSSTAWIVGGLFFIGGLINVLMLPSPKWFTICDLGFAYFPMAWIAQLILKKKM